MVAGMSGRAWILAAAVIGGAFRTRCAADEALLVLAGPAMGTTYRVVLAAELQGRARGELHREIEAVARAVAAATSRRPNAGRAPD